MFDFLMRIRARRVFNVADAGAGGGGGADDGAAAAAAAAAGGTGGDGSGAAGGGADGGAKSWWEGEKFSASQREQLTALGLTVDDPLDAVVRLADMESNAKKKLGKPADQLISKPGKDQDVADWMRENASVFGIPEAADKYTIEKPQDWPKDAAWDTDMEAKARELGHKMGLNGSQLQGVVNLYAEKMAGMLTGAEKDLETSSAELRADLQKDWGDQYGSKVALAQQAASVLAEQAGLDSTGLMNIAQVLQGATGDANTLRLFATIGEMMGEDRMIQMPGNGGGLGTTPAEAQTQLNAMLKPDSDYAKAVADKRAGKPGAAARYTEMENQRTSLEKIISAATAKA
ncbi:hypothetical protein P775_08400 [Puniceibacterium antarcticum]|uniref:Uncharacterized protein n=1 Tax=Puniceibacterium antarcticum TaxID=1206336 RepID=A0A2G8RG62_9RHOB|nr:hypothetical protein [Puniceibacterium antarcticum]PIL20540.1 hypothetical protein P775_08400 [Puniceibacterium antarcticum]